MVGNKRKGGEVRGRGGGFEEKKRKMKERGGGMGKEKERMRGKQEEGTKKEVRRK